jgi:hypothetical protein
VAHAASDGAVRIPNRRKALRLKPHFAKLRFKVGAAIYARIQIDVDHVGYVVKMTQHSMYDVYLGLFLYC